MKNIYTFLVFMFGCGVLFSQNNFNNSGTSNDCCEKVAQQGVTISKQKDTIKALSKVVLRLQQDSVAFHKENAKLKDELTRLDKKSLKNENKNLKDSIVRLNDTVKLYKDNLISERSTQKERNNERYQKGRMDVLNMIEESYRGNFEELIKTMQNPTGRDLDIIGSDNTSLNNLNVFFSAKNVLNERYAEKRVKESRANLSKLPQTQSVKDLDATLNYYKYCFDELKNVVEKIIDIDKRKTAGNDSEIVIFKRNDIIAILADYIFNYRFSFDKYPYLANIVTEILERKHSDPDADISDLLKLL